MVGIITGLYMFNLQNSKLNNPKKQTQVAFACMCWTALSQPWPVRVSIRGDLARWPPIVPGPHLRHERTQTAAARNTAALLL